MDNKIPHPEIVSRTQWLGQRKSLLGAEKELTRHDDRVNADRRRLPMVELDKNTPLNEHPGRSVGWIFLMDVGKRRAGSMAGCGTVFSEGRDARGECFLPIGRQGLSHLFGECPGL